MVCLNFECIFLCQYNDEVDEMLSRIVTEDETWVSHLIRESKQRYRVTQHLPLRSKPKKHFLGAKTWQQCSGAGVAFF